jgi:hypothetical protein
MQPLPIKASAIISRFDQLYLSMIRVAGVPAGVKSFIFSRLGESG